MNVTFTEDSLAPPHRAIRPSLRSTSYTRLSSNLIVRLNNDDEFILVVPSISNDTPTDSLSALRDTHNKINTVLLESCSGLAPSDKKEQLSRLKQRHLLPRGSSSVYEFPVRIKNYAERDQIANNSLRKSDIDLLWNTGFGFKVELCGYAKTKTVLLRMKHFAHLEFYKTPEFFARDDIGFKRTGDLNEPLLDQLWGARGCTTTTIQVMMKFYKELSNRKQKTITNLKRTKKATNQSKGKKQILRLLLLILIPILTLCPT